MTDFIFVVRDPGDWHRQNRQINPHHYCRHPYWDAFLQPLGGSIYYNADVLIPNGMVNSLAVL